MQENFETGSGILIFNVGNVEFFKKPDVKIRKNLRNCKKPTFLWPLM